MVFRRTKTSVTAWSVIREYMSKCSYGSLVTQKAIRAILEERAENYRKYGSVTTMNAYFNLMAGAGYIRHSPRHGIWVVVKPVPSDLTASKLKIQYSNRSQRRGYAYGSLQDRNSSRKLF